MGIILFVLVPVSLTRSGGMLFLSLVKGPVFTREILTSQSHHFGSDRLGNPPSPWDHGGHTRAALVPHPI